MKILSIDAWRYDKGWTWNNWHHVGDIDRATLDSLTSARRILRYMREQGYLSDYSKGRVSVEDDQYNIVIQDRSNGEPLFAIEYGPEYY